ncbi:hypothetical protein CONPUDRAFT_137701 [Coniophora puteana RWD-64-598 SS2]|uniref:Uncharacterized protein n=1 Tax=Coniophora puteana (strain RWD-64-598) TaxID=741705 RepID=A0A5M3MMW2_CONPW|nr:uncharacterized protein CONPUDRAFT_137701 [Coniophora puteana RWD-64-598 SS2]EIW80532.1 hypothetical protein CONPUDRAFT_137701 [Coniophora puteana RWD-64-598 SS2]
MSLIQKFEASGRRISMLPRTSQALTLGTMAMTARISSHPLLFGTSCAPPRLLSVIFDDSRVGVGSVPEWGRRRENACRRLREMALESAWDARLLRGQGGDSSEDEEMAACLLLAVIEDRYALGQGQIWHAAFVSLLRRKLEARRKAEWDPSFYNSPPSTGIALGSSSSSGPSPPGPGLARRSPRYAGLAWSIHIMRDSLSAASRGHLCSYTLHDEELVMGLPPAVPEIVLEHSTSFGLSDPAHPRDPLEGEVIRTDWWDFGAYYCLVRPLTYRMTEIALGSYEFHLARSHHSPLDAKKLENYVASLIPMQRLLNLAGERLAMLVSPIAVGIRRYAGRGGSSQHVTGDEHAIFTKLFQNGFRAGDGAPTQGTDGVDGIHSPKDELRAQEVARSLHLFLRACMGAILFPVFNDLWERIQAIDNGRGCPGDDRERLSSILDNIRKALLPYVLVMLRSLTSVVHLAWVTSAGESLRQASLRLGRSPNGAPSPDDATTPITALVTTPTPVPYSETQTLPLDSGLLHPSSFAWEGKVMQIFRMCTSPHLFGRPSWEEPFSIWSRVILSSTPIEDGGTDLSRSEKLAGTRILLDIARVMAWAFPTISDDLIYEVHKTYEGMKALGISEDTAGPGSSSDLSVEGALSDASDRYSGLIPKVTPAEAVPTVKEVLEGVPHERVSDVFFGGGGATGLGLEGHERDSRFIEDLCLDLNRLKIDKASSHTGTDSVNASPGQVMANDARNTYLNMLAAGPSSLRSPSTVSSHSQPSSMLQDVGVFNPTMNYAPSVNQVWNAAAQPESSHPSYTLPTWEGASPLPGSSQGFAQQSPSYAGDLTEEALSLHQQGYQPDSLSAFPVASLDHESAAASDPVSYPTEAELEDEFQRIFGGRKPDEAQDRLASQGFNLESFNWSGF